MFVNLFTALGEALNSSMEFAVAAAFIWGLLSILLSPCHLSSIPLVIGFLNTQGQISIGRSFKLSLMFAIGILVSIALIGFITAAIGRLYGDIGTTGNYLVAAIFIVIGLYLLDILYLPWNGFNFLPKHLQGTAAALILGFLLGIGLGPCTFAFLAPLLIVVFQLASANISKAAFLITAFALGHCAVIVGAGTFTMKLQQYLNWTGASRMATYLKRACGVLVICAGIYMVFWI